MSIFGGLAMIHALAARVVLGKRLCQRTASDDAEARERLDKLRAQVDELDAVTIEIARDSGILVSSAGDEPAEGERST